MPPMISHTGTLSNAASKVERLRRKEREASVQDDAYVARADVAGVVLAGTHSWRPCPLEQSVPRPLLPIVNRPLITYVLDWLGQGGVCAASVCGNSDTGAMRRALSAQSGDRVRRRSLDLEFYEDVAPRGPAGCVHDAASLSGCDTFIVVDGTIVPSVDVGRILEAHRRHDAALTVVVTECSDGGSGSCARVVSRPTGIYVFSRRALAHVSKLGYQDIKETLIPKLNRADETVWSIEADGPVPRVTGVDSYMAVNEWALTRSLDCGDAFPDHASAIESRIHKSATIDSTARLVGPIVIGAGTQVGRGATLVGPTTIGTDCCVGSGAVICRSCVWDGCRVDRGAVLDRCILMNRSRVRSESAHRYVIVAPERPRLEGIGRVVRHWVGRRP